MNRALARVSVTVLASVAMAVGSLATPAQAAPAQAAAANVKIPSSVTVPLGGNCFDIPVRIQPPSGTDDWTLETEVASSTVSDYAYGYNDRAATSQMLHCPGLDGVGKFSWKSTLTWSTDDGETERTSRFSGTYTVVKAKRTGKLTISDRTPRFGQKITLKMCIPGPRYVDYKFQMKVAGKTHTTTSTTGSKGCETVKLKWPRTKQAIKFRMQIPGDDVAKKYVGKWVTVRGHA